MKLFPQILTINLIIFLLDEISCLKNLTIENTNISITEQGGKFILENLTNSTKSIFDFSLISITETDKDGKLVGKSDGMHSISELEKSTFIVRNQTECSFEQIKTNLITFDTDNQLNNKAQIFINLYIFKDNGEISYEEAKKTVKKGDILFDINIKNWKFCELVTNPQTNTTSGNCSSGPNIFEKGEFLDLTFKIKRSNNFTKISEILYNYGAINFILPKNIFVSSTHKHLPDNFPKVENKEDSDLFTVRFPYFEKEANYQPLIYFNSTQQTPYKPSEPIIVDNIVSKTKTSDYSNVTFTLLGGKVELNFSQDKKELTYSFDISFDSIFEYDGNNKEVGKIDGNHALKKFDEMKFYVYSQIGINDYKLNASEIVGKFDRNGVSGMGLVMTVFNEDGEITVGNGTSKIFVKSGDFKYDIFVKDWNFCYLFPYDNVTIGNCPLGNNTFENGAFIDVKMKIKSNKKSLKIAEKNFLYGESILTFPQYYYLDNKIGLLADGYPKYETVGEYDYFTFRFPKFEKLVKYEMVINFPTFIKSNSLLVSVVIVIMVLVLVIVGFFIYCRISKDKLSSSSIEAKGRFVEA